MANVTALQQAILSGNRAAVDAQIATMSAADVPVVMSFFNGLGTADKQALANVFDKNPGIVPDWARGTVRGALAGVDRAATGATPAARTTAQQAPQQVQPTRRAPTAPAQQAPQARPQQAAQPQRQGFLSQLFNRGAQRPPAGAQPSRGPIATAFSNIFNGGAFGGGAPAPVSTPTIAANIPSSGYYGANPVEYGMAATAVPAGWGFSGGMWSRG